MADEPKAPVDEDALAAEWAAMAGDDDAEEGGAAAEAGEGADAPASDGDGALPDDAALAGQSGRALSQDEIDSLLGFDAIDSHANAQTGIRSIINSSLVSYGRLPMLEIVFDRLVRLLSTSMRNFTSDNVEVTLDNITSIRFGEYLNSIPLPAILTVFRAVEWDNFGLLTVESNLIYSIVDVLLGGRKGTTPMRIEGRPYTTIERNLVERMVHVVLKDMKTAFEPLTPVEFTFDRLEVNPRFATIAREPNAAILVRLRVDMEDRGGRLELVLPYATIEPVRELLLQMFMGEKFGRDTIWESHLATELWSTEVQVDAVIDELAMNLGDVMNFKVGQTIMLNCTPDSPIELQCGGTPMLRGRMGRVGSMVAVKVEESLMKARRGGGKS